MRILGERKSADKSILLEQAATALARPVVYLPHLDDQLAATQAARALFAEMKKKGMVTLSDLLEGKVEQTDRIDVDEIYRLGQAIGIETQKHGDFPISPKKVWVRLSHVTKQLRQPVDRRCKLRPEQVSEMRRGYEGKTSMRQLAKHYGVSVSTVSNIIHGFYWKKLT
jgi:hypothetical protein